MIQSPQRARMIQRVKDDVNFTRKSMDPLLSAEAEFMEKCNIKGSNTRQRLFEPPSMPSAFFEKYRLKMERANCYKLIR